MSPAAGAEAAERVDPVLRTFAFGERDGAVWGAGWIPAERDGAMALGVGSELRTEPLELHGISPHEPWEIRSQSSELVLEGEGEPVWVDPQAEMAGFDQLCRVAGTVRAGNGPRGVSTLGWRSNRGQLPEHQPGGSLRQAAAWFDSGDGFALLSVRPREDKGQERDQVTAALFATQHRGPVADPRLSTTYTSSGRPIRAGVELWVQAGEDPDQQYPRRALGEALKPPVELALEDLTLRALPVRWYGSGGVGGGIYLLGTWAASGR